ncbi:hypothetical protein BAUCODRAFT_36073 [Baudoinia panamericana UAMH 10762]|uniref:AB hydrolase-1 domain-containing protein n=1 Tax=Baudoinia panamericana (strain UAMH 10762) TaxID=717646 RepID=M2N6U9_BAUPA|nr:uncharacterized protein BAUCODRAFT_36073 [Baudoinia panamericana UAMH 10762]EMC94814.1 hypothetical protein BAUCODRAFT_36073 [Baudoinia panamericana UAMH 10762]
MPSPATAVLGRIALFFAVAVGLYAALLGVLLHPTLQRFALYVNKLNTLPFGDDLNNGESFGYSKHQVTPFELPTPDGETLYAWHILPLDVYARHEQSLREEQRPHLPMSMDEFRRSSAFQFLTSDEPVPAQVIVAFHGNAGHIAQGWRTDTYRQLALRPNTHVLTIDYRGFGHSTGSPTEAGLITDGTALIDWVMHAAGIPPERIVVLGQSLGTAVSSAVTLHFADPSSELIPSTSRELRPLLAKEGSIQPTAFAGVVLVAPFSSLPSLLLTYRIGGFLPILLPLRPFPYIAGMLTSRMVDTWRSADRLAAYYQALANSPLTKSDRTGRVMGSLQLVHSIRDMDIPYHQTEMICRRVFGGGFEPGVYEKEEDSGLVDCVDGSRGAAVLDVKAANRPRVRFEIIEYGGHNRIITYSQVAAAISRVFDNLFD